MPLINSQFSPYVLQERKREDYIEINRCKTTSFYETHFKLHLKQWTESLKQSNLLCSDYVKTLYCIYFAALYLFTVSVLAGFVGQLFVRKLLRILGRASIIVFILSGVIFASALTMGKSIRFNYTHTRKL